MSFRQIVKDCLPGPLRSRLLASYGTFRSLSQRIRLSHRLRPYRGRRKILYAITPHPGLSNVGDHAQAIAINRWLREEFPSLPVLEVDKAEVTNFLNIIEHVMTPDDIIVLHSGGNMGDRGLYSENARRAVISTFPDHPIISLPQTIYFSDTAKGRKELAKSVEVYNRHPRLLIMARDVVSYKLAKKHFPQCRTNLCPDFVLYLDDELSAWASRQDRSERVLLCLRHDEESILDTEDRHRLAEALPYPCDTYDTTIPRPIPRASRRAELDRTVDLFSSHALVVTDRMHGMVFSVVTRTPCIALPTVDHKIRASYEWFREVRGLQFLQDITPLAEAAAELHGAQVDVPINWRETYFEGRGRKLLEAVTDDRGPDG